jgi:Zn-finger nucleic acid-binding protein
MKCPQCQQPDLVMADRQGVEIDYCPQCRGVWLDRGELDKIIERAAQYESGVRGREYDRDDADDDDERQRHYNQQRHSSPNQPPPLPPQQQSYHQKKKSFWSDLFD